jgi:hypothetical protein
VSRRGRSAPFPKGGVLLGMYEQPICVDEAQIDDACAYSSDNE